MVSADATEDGNEEGAVGVMRRLVDDRQVRRAFLGPTQIDAVALGTLQFVELLTCCNHVGGSRLASLHGHAVTAARSEGERDDERRSPSSHRVTLPLGRQLSTAGALAVEPTRSGRFAPASMDPRHQRRVNDEPDAPESLHNSVRERSTLRSNWALAATITVEALISAAAAAGGNTIPAHANAPAARGMATTL